MILELNDETRTGYRIDTAGTRTLYGETVDIHQPPDRIPCWAITDWGETPDAVTGLRPSDVLAGYYVHDGFAPDGVPSYSYFRADEIADLAPKGECE